MDTKTKNQDIPGSESTQSKLHPNSSMERLTVSQQKALSVVPHISGLASLCCSALIAWYVIRGPKQRANTYHRLLCGISLVDMFTSFWLGLSTWPVPRDSITVYAIGTTTTCHMQGFFIQAGIASSFYNASLSIYYVMVICYGWKQIHWKRHAWVEWCLHGIPLAWGLITSAICLGVGAFGNASLWCWISPDFPSLRWSLFYGPLWCMIGIVSANCIIIYRHVREIERKSARYLVMRQEATWKKQALNTTEKRGQEPQGQEHQEEHYHSVRSQQEPQELEQEEHKHYAHSHHVANGNMPDEATDMEDPNFSSAAMNSKEFASSSNTLQDQIILETQPAISTDAVVTLDNSPQSSSSSVRCVSVQGRPTEHNQHQQQEQECKHTRRVARLCFRYAAALYFNWIPITLVRVSQAWDPDFHSFGLLLVCVLTVPILGLPNFLIYLGPQLWASITQQYRERQQQLQRQRQYHQEQQKDTNESAIPPAPSLASVMYGGIRRTLLSTEICNEATGTATENNNDVASIRRSWLALAEEQYSPDDNHQDFDSHSFQNSISASREIGTESNGESYVHSCWALPGERIVSRSSGDHRDSKSHAGSLLFHVKENG